MVLPCMVCCWCWCWCCFCTSISISSNPTCVRMGSTITWHSGLLASWGCHCHLCCCFVVLCTVHVVVMVVPTPSSPIHRNRQDILLLCHCPRRRVPSYATPSDIPVFASTFTTHGGNWRVCLGAIVIIVINDCRYRCCCCSRGCTGEFWNKIISLKLFFCELNIVKKNITTTLP